MAERLSRFGSRFLGIGLAAMLSVVTLALGVTGRLTLYIAPETVWFACAAAVLTLIGAILSCTLPLGAEEDHGHDHAQDHDDHDHEGAPRRVLATTGTVAAGVVATGVAAAALILPPASLSVELAMSRAQGSTALFAGADTPTLGVADTTTFGIGDWSTVFATATRPEAYDGSAVTITGFVTPGEDGVNLTRMVITHCVIDAQTAAVPVDLADGGGDYATGEWLQITGTVKAEADGSLRVVPSEVVAIDEPGDPYEY